MARVGQLTSKTYRIDTWRGLNESTEGDTNLKLGELSSCENWRITRDGTMRRRPGTKTRQALGGPVRGMWSGRVQEQDVFVAAANGHLWKLSDASGEWVSEDIGAVDTSGRVSFFPWGGNLYVLDGNSYQVWDGGSLTVVEGYRPIVTVAVPPSGGGTTLEQVNKLNAKRRSWFSPDGTAVTFQLPETGLVSVDWVKAVGGGAYAASAYSVNLTNGTVTFSDAPAQGVNSIEIAWTVGADYREQVEAMRYSELYNGSNDNRIFLYGDGSNKVIYSGIAQEDGEPRADYFPDLNEIAVGDENTPVTGLLRHYSRLLVFKTSSTWVVSYGTMTLEDDTVTASFWCTPVNRSLGNEPMGQVQLVLNSARSLCAGAVYEWKNNSSYTSNLTVDERQARRLSDRVARTIQLVKPAECICWDDNYNQEYYICCEDNTIVHNYAADAWYFYKGRSVTAFCRVGDYLYIGTDDGLVCEVNDQYNDDDGAEIKARAETGAMAFSAENIRKYFAEIWITSKPQEMQEFVVGAQTDTGARHEATIAPRGSATLSFAEWDFTNLGFGKDVLPAIDRARLRARRFAYVKLSFDAKPGKSASVLSALVTVTYGGKKL